MIMKKLPAERCLVMGILNVTPDSFYDGGRYSTTEKSIERARQIFNEGADIIDIGGESSRPGSLPIPVQEEIDRVCPVIEYISKNIDISISIDTYKSKVADAAIKAGAKIVNDISAMSIDEEMAAVVAAHKTHIVLMHMKGEPQTMQNDTYYDDLLDEIYLFLGDRVKNALLHGIAHDKIIIDPGIGFGKSLNDNYEIIKNLNLFKELGFPLLIGLSRKSLIGQLYEEGADRLPATIALNTISVIKGADIIRVHDVREHCLALKAIEMLK